MSGKTTSRGQSAAETSTSDTPDTATPAVEVSDSGVDTSNLTEAQKAVAAFEPVKMYDRDGAERTARTQAQVVALKFDGYSARKPDEKA